MHLCFCAFLVAHDRSCLYSLPDSLTGPLNPPLGHSVGHSLTPVLTSALALLHLLSLSSSSRSLFAHSLTQQLIPPLPLSLMLFCILTLAHLLSRPFFPPNPVTHSPTPSLILTLLRTHQLNNSCTSSHSLSCCFLCVLLHSCMHSHTHILIHARMYTRMCLYKRTYLHGFKQKTSLAC